MALITIIVPVYKVERYLARCVDSILKQTFDDYEVILVDDGSPDRCGELCEEYASKDQRIIVLHQKNGGLSVARNSGLDWMFHNSDSRYVTFVDSDDWLHPKYLEELYRALDSAHVKVSVCCQKRSKCYTEADFSFTQSSNVTEQLTPEELLLNHEWNYNYAWGKLYERNLFTDVRYPAGKNFEDVFTTYKALYQCDKVVWINQELYFYFVNDAGISRSPWSPSELVVFDGMRQQLKFYKEKGYQRAFEKEEWLYVNHHAYQIERIRANKNDLKKNKKYIKRLKKDMMRFVKQSPEKYGYRKMPQCYDAAYPVTMDLYHRLGNIVHKIR